MTATKIQQNHSIQTNSSSLKVFHYFDWSLVVSLLSQLDRGYVHEFQKTMTEDRSSSNQQSGPFMSGAEESRTVIQSSQELQRSATHHHAFERLSATLESRILYCDLDDNTRSDIEEGSIVRVSSKLAIADYRQFTKISGKMENLVKLMEKLLLDPINRNKGYSLSEIMPKNVLDRIKHIGQYFEFFDRSDSLYALLYPNLREGAVWVKCPLIHEAIEGGLKHFLQLFGSMPSVNFEVLGIITNKQSEITPDLDLEELSVNGVDAMMLNLGSIAQSLLRSTSPKTVYEMTMQPIAIYRTLV